MTRRKKMDVYGEPKGTGVLVARANGQGALQQGGSHANSGPLRSELRAEMRGSIKEWWPKIREGFDQFDDGDKLKAVDLAGKYGLGLQTQQLTPAAIEEQVQALGTVIMEKLKDAGYTQDAAEAFMADVVQETKRRLEQ